VNPYDHSDQRSARAMRWAYWCLVAGFLTATSFVTVWAAVEARHVLVNKPAYCVPSKPHL